VRVDAAEEQEAEALGTADDEEEPRQRKRGRPRKARGDAADEDRAEVEEIRLSGCADAEGDETQQPVAERQGEQCMARIRAAVEEAE
jgi:hypothetical protein